MRLGYFWRLVAFTTVLMASPNVWAVSCLSHAPTVSDEDMEHPPRGAYAFRAEILKIVPHGRMDTKPHLGFAVDYKIVQMFRGQLTKNYISVEYGSCQDLPGNVGDTVPVLAVRDRFVDWFAPEFWRRSE